MDLDVGLALLRLVFLGFAVLSWFGVLFLGCRVAIICLWVGWVLMVFALRGFWGGVVGFVCGGLVFWGFGFVGGAVLGVGLGVLDGLLVL